VDKQREKTLLDIIEWERTKNKSLEKVIRSHRIVNQENRILKQAIKRYACCTFNWKDAVETLRRIEMIQED